MVITGRGHPGRRHPDRRRQRDQQGGLRGQQDSEEPGQAGQRPGLAAGLVIGPPAHQGRDHERGDPGGQHDAAPGGRPLVLSASLHHGDRMAVGHRRDGQADRPGEHRGGNPHDHPVSSSWMPRRKRGGQRGGRAGRGGVQGPLPSYQLLPPPEARLHQLPVAGEGRLRGTGLGLILAGGRDAYPPQHPDHAGHRGQRQGDPPSSRPASVPSHPARQQRARPAGRLPGDRAHRDRHHSAGELNRCRQGQ